MYRILLFIALFMFCNRVYSQQKMITGIVKGVTGNNNENNKFSLEPLPGANVYWAKTNTGTSSGLEGEFELEIPDYTINQLVVSYIGYQSDTFLIKDYSKPLEIILATNGTLDAVIISERINGAFISKLKPLKTEVITSEGLSRLACCNLSESFENNASVDVGYSDAVSGAKQIKMLGLAGVYSQLLSENIPSIRGLATTYGLNYIPGSWMESIQISKGSASVINGYESITGQINVEFKKPVESPPLYINVYANNFGRGELNLLTAKTFNKKVSSMFMGHVNYLDNIMDYNEDGFLDMPKSKQINLYNRWNFKFKNGKGQLGIKALNETREGGQTVRFKGSNPLLYEPYEIDIETKRMQMYGKRGFPVGDKGSSIGFIGSASIFEQDALFGLNNYIGEQTSVYSNAIYQNYFSNPRHQLSSGLSYQYDDYKEEYNDTLFRRTERVPGVFSQYTFNKNDELSIVAGFRFDYNSEFGDLLTPRLHFKWNVFENGVFRASVGRGYRSVNIFAENIGLLASSKKLIFEEAFEIEEAWNYGVNYTFDFSFVGEEPATLALDFYRTDFSNQIVVDMDQDYTEVHLYNLDGNSYSNSFQVEFLFKPIERLEINTAFRVNDVKTDLHSELKEKPFVNKYKGLVTFSYATNHDLWQFDLTNQFVGQSRLPSTAGIPTVYARKEKSPEYYILHAQAAKRFKYFEVYLGGENLTDFTQKKPIIAANDPYGDYFNTAHVWGPIMGRKIYAGIRLTIK